MRADNRKTTITLPGRPEQVCVARHWLADWLGAGHPAVDTALLLLSETFSNSVLYGHPENPGSPVEVTAELLDRLLRLDVTDAGNGGEPVLGSDMAGDAERGRGLAILDLLAKEWSWKRLDDRRLSLTVTIEF
jgi:anti-sigma regulatory factor (Ser/Thr protein kinase)